VRLKLYRFYLKIGLKVVCKVKVTQKTPLVNVK